MNSTLVSNLDSQLLAFNQMTNPVGLEFNNLDEAKEKSFAGDNYLVVGTTPISEILLSKTTGEIFFLDEPTKTFVNSSLQHFVNCLTKWHSLLMAHKNMSDEESVTAAKKFLTFVVKDDFRAVSDDSFWHSLANEVIEMHDEFV